MAYHVAAGVIEFGRKYTYHNGRKYTQAVEDHLSHCPRRNSERGPHALCIDC